MTNSVRVTLVLISILIFAASYWYWFSTSAEMWKVNNEIQKSWNKKSDTMTIPEKETEKKVTSEASRLASSGRDPIILEGRGNYVTGRDVTFVVPNSMRRIQLTIQDRLGRRVSSYTLPNSFIGIRPGQRINLRVVE